MIVSMLFICSGFLGARAPPGLARVKRKINEKVSNTSLAAPGALTNRLQRRTARKANKANLGPQNQKSEITSL